MSTAVGKNNLCQCTEARVTHRSFSERHATGKGRGFLPLLTAPWVWQLVDTDPEDTTLFTMTCFYSRSQVHNTVSGIGRESSDHTTHKTIPFIRLDRLGPAGDKR